MVCIKVIISCHIYHVKCFYVVILYKEINLSKCIPEDDFYLGMVETLH